MPMNARLTKRIIDALKPGSIAWDSDVKGFGVRCQARRKVYILKVRIKGRQRWLVIGDHGSPWTAETARHEAQRLWGEIRSGIDVAQVREAEKREPTMAMLCHRYLEEHSRQHKKPLSVASDERNITNHVLPLLGDRLVSEITRSDIEEAKRRIREGKTAKQSKGRLKGGNQGRPTLGGPGVANRTVSLLSHMLNKAEEWGWRQDHTNPCRKVARYRERKLERFLTSEEMQRLGAALRQVEAEQRLSIWNVAAIRLLIYTGARLGEVLALKWSYVDWERGYLALPDSKTGAKPIILNDAALDVLRTTPRVKGNPFVFVGRNEGQPIVNLQEPWRIVRKLAEIPDVRIHDLRHSFASFGVMTGGSLPMIGKLLGHGTPITTARYAHLADGQVRQFNQSIGDAISTALNGSDGEMITSIDRDVSGQLGSLRRQGS